MRVENYSGRKLFELVPCSKRKKWRILRFVYGAILERIKAYFHSSIWPRAVGKLLSALGKVHLVNIHFRPDAQSGTGSRAHQIIPEHFQVVADDWAGRVDFMSLQEIAARFGCIASQKV